MVKKPLRLITLTPNFFSIMNACSGLTALFYGLKGEYFLAIVFMILSVYFDMLDGFLAKLLKVKAKMGADLDSICDAISFGAVPGLLVYYWMLQGTRFGWIVMLFYCSCAILRLARFNSLIDEPKDGLSKDIYFFGLAAPGAAFYLLLPLLIHLADVNYDLSNFRWFVDFVVSPYFIIPWSIIISFLMISNYPNFSLKFLLTNKAVSRYAFMMALVIIFLQFEYTVIVSIILIIVHILLYPITFFYLLTFGNMQNLYNGKK